MHQFAANLPPSDREGQTDWDRQVESEELWMRAQPATSEFALNGEEAMISCMHPSGGSCLYVRLYEAGRLQKRNVLW